VSKIKRVTLNQVMAWEPCAEYSRADIKKLFGRRKYATAQYVFDLDIPAQDKLWVLLHEEFIPENELRLLACEFAMKALSIFEKQHPDDDRPRRCIQVARRYACGRASDEELNTAGAAARAMAAAGDAAGDAAWAMLIKWQLGRVRATLKKLRQWKGGGAQGKTFMILKIKKLYWKWKGYIPYSVISMDMWKVDSEGSISNKKFQSGRFIVRGLEPPDTIWVEPIKNDKY